MHITCTDLDDVNVIEELEVCGVHELGDDGEAGFLFGCEEHVEADLAESLEGVGGGAGFEGTAAKEGCTGCLDGLCDGDDLLIALYAAGTCDYLEVAAADLVACAIDDGVIRVEFAVGCLVGLLDATNGVDDIECLYEADVEVGDIAYASDECFVRTDRDLRVDFVFLEPCDEVVDLALFCVLFNQNDHGVVLSGSEERREMRERRPAGAVLVGERPRSPGRQGTAAIRHFSLFTFRFSLFVISRACTADNQKDPASSSEVSLVGRLLFATLNNDKTPRFWERSKSKNKSSC